MTLSKNTIWRLCHMYRNNETGRLYFDQAYLDRSRYNGDGTRKTELHYDLVRDGKLTITPHTPEAK